jgi:hypothetical protein
MERNDFKSEAARARFLVYQEGQRAHTSGASCPYFAPDWRAKTWAKGVEAAQQHWKEMTKQQMSGEESPP